MDRDRALEAGAEVSERVATQTLIWFMITSLIAVAIGIGLGLLTNPGRSADVSTEGAAYEGSTGSWLDFLTGLVPANFLGLSVSDDGLSFSVLQIVVVALAIGAASLRAGEKAKKYFAGERRWGAWPAIQLAFVTRSSVGTMPLTQRVTMRNLGVPTEYASVALPFGATTKMDGCAAIYPALAAITVAQIFGVQLGLQDYLLIAIDPILDMMRTATNVAGQALVPTIGGVHRRRGRASAGGTTSDQTWLEPDSGRSGPSMSSREKRSLFVGPDE